MRKEYKSPDIKVIKVESGQILAGSTGNLRMNDGFNIEDVDDDQVDGDNVYGL